MESSTTRTRLRDVIRRTRKPSEGSESTSGSPATSSGQPSQANHAPQPDFIGIGAQKAATGWLYGVIKRHPDVGAPPVKELNFWATHLNYRKAREACSKEMAKSTRTGRPIPYATSEFLRRVALAPEGQAMDPTTQEGIDYYGSLFSLTTKRVTGEISPVYSGLQPERIRLLAQHFPDVKILFQIRNPVDRYWSMLNHYWRSGSLKLDQLKDPTVAVDLLKRRKLYQERSYPTVTYGRWKEVFPDDQQFRVIFFDDVKQDPSRVASDVLEFLDLDPQQQPEQAVSNNRKAKLASNPISEEVFDAIKLAFADELDACGQVFGGPALTWKDVQYRPSTR